MPVAISKSASETKLAEEKLRAKLLKTMPSGPWVDASVRIVTRKGADGQPEQMVEQITALDQRKLSKRCKWKRCSVCNHDSPSHMTDTVDGITVCVDCRQVNPDPEVAEIFAAFERSQLGCLIDGLKCQGVRMRIESKSKRIGRRKPDAP